ncbi:MAG: dTMP kinase [Candidatus Promineifilaceae bacterium]|nr:dTMP kinase [Candidatus Promineifilaceae bacterium]
MLITFEGSEGSGKSTQIEMLARFLRERGHRVTTTREPGGTRIGEQVRHCLHHVDHQEMAPASEALLYSASRAQLVAEVIRPALADGHIVLSDRYSDSTLAYQGYGRGLDLVALETITHFATGGLRPDLTLFLDVDVRQGLARRNDSASEINRMDMQTEAFYQRVRDGYLELMRQDPARWRIVDASLPVEQVQRLIRRVVLQQLGAEQEEGATQ